MINIWFTSGKEGLCHKNFNDENPKNRDKLGLSKKLVMETNCVKFDTIFYD